MAIEGVEPEIHSELYEPQILFDGSDNDPTAPLTDFEEPERRDARETPSGDEQSPALFRTLNYKEDVAEFVSIDSEAKMAEWAERLHMETESLFGRELADYGDIEAYKADEPRSLLSLRSHMDLAMRLRRLACSSEITLESMVQLGIQIAEEGETPEGNRYFSASLPIGIQGEALGEYVQKGTAEFCGRINELASARLGESEGIPTLVISDRFGFIDTTAGMQGCCALLLDALSEIHLHGISTVTNKGVPKQRADCIVADLWYRMSEHFRLGKVVLCAYSGCRKPLIAYENQGLPRRYCGERCRDRARRQRQREAKRIAETNSPSPQPPRERRDGELPAEKNPQREER